MPLYEYLCGSCGHRFERIQKFSDAPISECPSCGAAQVEKLISSPAIQFKGSGWYITDYARSGSSNPSASGGEKAAGEKAAGDKASGDKASPASTSSDSASKPAAKESPSPGAKTAPAASAKS